MQSRMSAELPGIQIISPFRVSVTCSVCGKPRNMTTAAYRDLIRDGRLETNRCKACGWTAKRPDLDPVTLGKEIATPCGSMILAPERNRCKGYEKCEHADDCLDKAAKRVWPGWVARNGA